MAMNVGSLKKFIKDMDDSIILHNVNGVGMIPSVKHAHIVKYKDGSGKEMLVFCASGNHVPDNVELYKGAH